MSMNISGDYNAYGAGYYAGKMNAPEKSAMNTDEADREIERLKEEKRRLEQQLAISADETKRDELEKKIAEIERELRQKDTDAYRRGHAKGADA